MIELWQAEWCPASRRIRQRLTELDVAYVVRQVPVERAERWSLLAATGSETIPTLVLEDGTVIAHEEEIGAWLDEHLPESAGAGAHRAKAEKVRAKELGAALAARQGTTTASTRTLEAAR